VYAYGSAPLASRGYRAKGGNSGLAVAESDFFAATDSGSPRTSSGLIGVLFFRAQAHLTRLTHREGGRRRGLSDGSVAVNGIREKDA
jgi:hypothetical protein